MRLLRRLVSLAMTSFASSSNIGVSAGAGASSGRGVVWYKSNDLRTIDHAPLLSAHAEMSTVNHVYVFDPRQFRTTRLGYAKTSRRRLTFLCECLDDLNANLQTKFDSRLTLLVGRPEVVLPLYCSALSATHLYCHDEVAHEEQTVLRAVGESLRQQQGGKGKAKGVHFQSNYWGGGTLLQPQDLPFAPQDLAFFTGFRKAVEANGNRIMNNIVPLPSLADGGIAVKPHCNVVIAEVAEGGLLEYAPMSEEVTAGGGKGGERININVPALAARLLVLGSMEREEQAGGIGGCAPSPSSSTPSPYTRNPGVCEEGDASLVDVDPRTAFPYQGGETQAWARVEHYITQGQGKLSVYKDTRNGMVGADYSSKLSPFLAMGCISARSVLQAVRTFEQTSGISNESTYWLIFELLWRDYMHFYALKYGKKMFYLGGPQGKAGRAKHEWAHDEAKVEAWRSGATGYPFVDANMRELLYTGFMSNRGRQVVASFLVRDLGQDWRLGAEHFESLLLDHDVCSNFGNWQYSAGVGADPREDRYFNIVKQGNDYDPDAQFVRHWCPELAALPNRILLDPRQLSSEQRERFKISTSTLPLAIAPLAMVPPAREGGGGGGRGSGGGGGGGGKGHAHGHVPGRKRTDGGGGGGGRGGGGGKGGKGGKGGGGGLFAS